MTLKEQLFRYRQFLEEQTKSKELDKLYKDLNQQYNKEFNEYLKDVGIYPNNEDFSVEVESLNHKIEVISQLRILYTHLTYEKNRNLLIQIIKSADSSINFELTELLKWKNFKKVMSAKGITLDKIKGFKSINEIRICSNYIKHSQLELETKEDDFFKISEFSKHSSKRGYPFLYIPTEYIDEFYQRTKYAGYIFLSNLCDEIEKVY